MKKYFPDYLRIIVFFFLFFAILELLIDSGDRPAFIKYPILNAILFIFLVVLIAIEMIFKAINNIRYNTLNEEQKKEYLLKKARPFMQSDFILYLKSKFTNNTTLKDEEQLLLEHDYDGIKELDNNLPPWWVYLFYICIFFGVIYMVKYELISGNTQEDEFMREMELARVEVEEYLKTAPDLVDENTVTLLTDEASLIEGKEIYITYCAACHRPDGGGQIGPNLTDKYWILGGDLKSIFHTINNGGRDGKGMVAWRGMIKPKEIQLVASYILSLNGSAPAEAKAPEGELWLEENEELTETTSLDTIK